METQHEFLTEDSRSLDFPDSDLVVTSPPYPMVEMWDDLFEEWTGKPVLSDPQYVFRQSHRHLERAWGRVIDSLSPGGVLCINIGDATRTAGDYQIWPNRDQIVSRLSALRFLGEIVWKKPSNSPSPFMGSGCSPPNQYVTLDHEHILIFRKGPNPESDPSSSYFWNERNRWFSDIWEVGSASQESAGNRDTSAAFPLELPLRLIYMYSKRGDTVLDPFAGTGTTGIASMIAGRNSVCVDVESSMREEWESRKDRVTDLSKTWTNRRIENHLKTVCDREPEHFNSTHKTSVVTKPEEDLELWQVSGVGSEGVQYERLGDFGDNPVQSGFESFY